MAKKSLGKEAIILTTSKVIVMIIGMVSSMLLSRFRTLEEYGTYSQLILTIQLSISIFTFGLPNAINYFLVNTEVLESKKKFLSIYYTLSTLLSILIGIVLLLFSPVISSYFQNDSIMAYLYVFALLPWTIVISSSIENVLIVYGKTKVLLYYRVSNSIMLLLAIIVSTIFKFSFNLYLIIYTSIQCFFALIVYMLVQNIVGKLKMTLDKKLIIKIVKFSVPIGLSTMVGTIGIELDKLVIGYFFNTEELAIYTNAAREMPITIISASLSAVLMPKLIQALKNNKIQRTINLWGNSITVSYIFICFFVTVLFVFAAPIISLLYSEKYLPGIAIFRIYSLILLLRVTYFGMILNSVGKTKFIFYSSIFSLVLNFILNIVFLKVLGLNGPAIATFIAVLAINLVQLKFTCKELSIKFSKIFPWKDLMKISILNIILGFFFITIQKILLSYFLSELLLSVLLGGIWFIVYILIIKSLLKRNWEHLNNY